jgi:hypothetical protein
MTLKPMINMPDQPIKPPIPILAHLINYKHITKMEYDSDDRQSMCEEPSVSGSTYFAFAIKAAKHQQSKAGAATYLLEDFPSKGEVKDA